jgi:hypothetical protein
MQQHGAKNTVDDDSTNLEVWKRNISFTVLGLNARCLLCLYRSAAFCINLRWWSLRFRVFLATFQSFVTRPFTDIITGSIVTSRRLYISFSSTEREYCHFFFFFNLFLLLVNYYYMEILIKLCIKYNGLKDVNFLNIISINYVDHIKYNNPLFYASCYVTLEIYTNKNI